ncbi:MAG TPA: hypothetical protein VIZ00_02105, partial [Streptosporangiaceae bacterium]
MSMPAAAWTALSSAAALAGAGLLLLGRQQPEAVRSARRWLAGAVLLWGGAAVIRGLGAGSVGSALPLAVTILLT